jgi:hypothetical protein
MRLFVDEAHAIIASWPGRVDSRSKLMTRLAGYSTTARFESMAKMDGDEQKTTRFLQKDFY